MATNQYFRYNVRSEQGLYEDLTIEALKMYGQDVYYLPREVVGVDQVWSDEILAKFDDAYKIEMYIENTEGFDGEGDLLTKFGVEIRDAATFIVARRRWNEEIASVNNENEQNKWYRPREGDLIHLPLSSSTFEITKVDTEQPFFQVSNLPVFRLQCELFEYSTEQFETDIEQIDRIEKAFTYQYKLDMDSDATGYIRGETVTQTFNDFTLRGEVVGWFDSSNELFLAHVGADDGLYHNFETGVNVVGGTSGSTYTPNLITEIDRVQSGSQNEVFDKEVVDFLDFSESNPFGDA